MKTSFPTNSPNIFIRFLFWDNYRCTCSLRNSTERSCVLFILCSPRVISWISIIQYYNQEPDIDRIYSFYSDLAVLCLFVYQFFFFFCHLVMSDSLCPLDCSMASLPLTIFQSLPSSYPLHQWCHPANSCICCAVFSHSVMSDSLWPNGL